MTRSLPTQTFGQLPDGRAATLFTLENDRLRVRITDFGGRMVSIETPDRTGRRDHVLLGSAHSPTTVCAARRGSTEPPHRPGRRDHVLLGFADVTAYNTYGGSFGCLLGRY